MGGGASRTVELAVTFRELAPQHEYVFAVSPMIAARLTEVPPRTRLMLVPQRLRSLAGRMAWEHLYLPSAFADAGADWVISPFNVLPLGPGLGRHAKQAVIVSNIGPFAPEIIASMHGYQAARNRLLRTLTLRSLERADHVFLLSGLARRLLEPRVDGKPVTALPMSPPTRHVLEAARSIRLPDAVAGVPFFVSVGEFFPYKGFEDAVRAIGLVRGSGPDGLCVCEFPSGSRRRGGAGRGPVREGSRPTPGPRPDGVRRRDRRELEGREPGTCARRGDDAGITDPRRRHAERARQLRRRRPVLPGRRPPSVG
jgi:glycosyltransferase involved in cell wall biosynthesis